MEINRKRRAYGEHLTPIKIFKKFIFPEISDKLYDYIWVDLFAGEGNLILPILEAIPLNKKIEFFKNHIYLFDIQKQFIDKAIENAKKYGIKDEIARKNIIQIDSIKGYPKFLLNMKLPIYHITNPPYLYIGYIVKNKETQKYLDYFKGENEGYQDLYQLALINDLRHGLEKMIYIIPSNFLFGFSVSNRIRDDFLKYYLIKKAIIFEKEVFEYTGTNVVLCFFERKREVKHEPVCFQGIKFGKQEKKITYYLSPENHYRAGGYFEDFVKKYKSSRPLRIKFYLTEEEINRNKGDFEIEVIDANCFSGKYYEKKKIFVNKKYYDKIKSNILFIKTIDSGSKDGRAGIYIIKDVYNVDGIVVSKAKYRTHPIQIFIEPSISKEDQVLLKDLFNILLEYFREKTDSEFMTTYKYSKSEYTRKYLGLIQVKKLIETLPLFSLKNGEKEYLERLIKYKKIEEIIRFIKKKNEKAGLQLWL